MTIPVAQKPSRKTWLVGGLAAAALAAVGVGVYLALPSQPPAAPAEAPLAVAAAQTAPAEPAVPGAAASQATVPKAAAARGVPAASPHDKTKAAAAEAVGVRPKEFVAAAPAMATVSFAIQPAGARCELHIDGVRMGMVDSSRDIRVAPGKHKIELRRVDWPGTYYGTVELKANENAKIPVTFSSL